MLVLMRLSQTQLLFLVHCLCGCDIQRQSLRLPRSFKLWVVVIHWFRPLNWVINSWLLCTFLSLSTFVSSLSRLAFLILGTMPLFTHLPDEVCDRLDAAVVGRRERLWFPRLLLGFGLAVYFSYFVACISLSLLYCVVGVCNWLSLNSWVLPARLASFASFIALAHPAVRIRTLRGQSLFVRCVLVSFGLLKDESGVSLVNDVWQRNWIVFARLGVEIAILKELTKLVRTDLRNVYLGLQLLLRLL